MRNTYLIRSDKGAQTNSLQLQMFLIFGTVLLHPGFKMELITLIDIQTMLSSPQIESSISFEEIFFTFTMKKRRGIEAFHQLFFIILKLSLEKNLTDVM